jgi:hypothetical protein
MITGDYRFVCVFNIIENHQEIRVLLLILSTIAVNKVGSTSKCGSLNDLSTAIPGIYEGNEV